MAFERFGEQKLTQDEARADLSQSIEFSKREPHNPTVWAHLGHLYDVLNEPYKALKCMKRAHKIKPDDVNCLNYGTILNQFSRFGEADALFEQAHKINPERKYISNALSETYIRNGEYIKGWGLFDSIRESSRNIHMEGCVEWDGVADLRGKKVAVISEGGAGDVYMMWRYVQLLADMGAKLSIVTFEPQIELLHHQKWAINSEGATYPFDYWISTFSFPAKFKTTVGTIPNNVPYMNSDPVRVSQYKAMFSKYPRPWVGLCWEAGEVIDPRKYRSITQKQAKRFLTVPGCTWFNMQFQTEPLLPHIINPEHRGWYDTAALLDTLDLFISVDTGIMNLAGGMGINVWTILGGWFDCKFSHQQKCPWYPTMRLFKNKALGFDRSVEIARDELKTYIKNFVREEVMV